MEISQNEKAKHKIAEAFIDRTRQFTDGSTDTEQTENVIKRIEASLSDKMDSLTVSDLLDLMSEFLSQEEINEILQELYDGGVEQGDVVELLRVRDSSDRDTVVDSAKERCDIHNFAILNIQITLLSCSSEVEDYNKPHTKLDSDLFMLCQTDTHQQDSSDIELTMDEIEYLNNLISEVTVTTETELSVAFEWSLNGTLYANYSNIMYRFLFGDETVSRNFTLALKFANLLSDKGLPSAQNVLAYMYKSGILQ